MGAHARLAACCRLRRRAFQAGRLCATCSRWWHCGRRESGILSSQPLHMPAAYRQAGTHRVCEVRGGDEQDVAPWRRLLLLPPMLRWPQTPLLLLLQLVHGRRHLACQTVHSSSAAQPAHRHGRDGKGSGCAAGRAAGSLWNAPSCGANKGSSRSQSGGVKHHGSECTNGAWAFSSQPSGVFVCAARPP